MKRITLHTFRKFHKIEESMIRAAMPRTSERDPQPVPFFADGPNTRKTSRTLTLGRPLTATISEMANA